MLRILLVIGGSVRKGITGTGQARVEIRGRALGRPSLAMINVVYVFKKGLRVSVTVGGL